MSRENTRYFSLKKALSKELKKPNPDKETCKALEMEIANIERQWQIVVK